MCPDVHRIAVAVVTGREVATRAMTPQRSWVIFFIIATARDSRDGARHVGTGRAGNAPPASLARSRYGIRTRCIAAGTIATEGMEQNYTAEDRAQWEAAVPLGRLGTAINPPLVTLDGVLGLDARIVPEC